METDKAFDSVLYKEDAVIEKAMLGQIYDKSQLEGKTTTFKIVGLGKNNFGKDTLLVKKDGVEYKLNISKTNINQLVELFGNSLKLWLNKEVKVTGNHWEGEIKGRQAEGVELVFSI